MTDGGTRLGQVTDVIVSLGSGPQAVGYELGQVPGHGGQSSFIPLPDQLALSGDVLMVPSELDHLVRDDLTGFGSAVAEFRSPRRAKNAHHRTSRAGARRRAGGEATKAELYEQAKAHDIAGRASMTKAELAAALEREETA
jgi:hypothetical protein